MTRLILILFFGFFSNIVLAQKKSAWLEINPFVRMDKYPEFSYSLNPTNSYYAKINGTSWGINSNYKFELEKGLFLKFGAGFYRYAFNKIDGKNTLSTFFKFPTRVLNFPSPVYIIFVTDKYWYNTISANFGVAKTWDIHHGWKLNTGIDLTNYFTFSQVYHMTRPYPVGPPNHKYKLKNKRYFGFSSSIELGLLKDFNKIKLGPSFILPVYDMWKQDKTFPKNENFSESNSNGRHKWFGGVGFGISINYSLTKNKTHEKYN